MIAFCQSVFIQDYDDDDVLKLNLKSIQIHTSVMFKNFHNSLNSLD